MRTARIANVLKHPITEWQVTRAKKQHRKEHPDCAVCRISKCLVTGRKNDVHHKVPVHVNPHLAAEPRNLVTLCRMHHFVVGHFRNWKQWNKVVGTTIRRVAACYDLIDEYKEAASGE